MTSITFDTLKLSQKLRDRAKYTPEQAESTAEVLAETFTEWQEQIATKEHLVTFKSEIKEDFSSLHTTVLRLETKIEAGNSAIMKYLFTGFIAVIGLIVATMLRH